MTEMLSFGVNIAFAGLLGCKTLEVHKQMSLYPFSKISHMSKMRFSHSNYDKISEITKVCS